MKKVTKTCIFECIDFKDTYLCNTTHNPSGLFFTEGVAALLTQEWE